MILSHLKLILDLRNLEHEISELEVHPIRVALSSTNNGIAIMILIGSFLIDFRQIRLRLRNYAEPKKTKMFYKDPDWDSRSARH